MTRRFGVIPKSSKPGHWRLIVDLSAPSSASVNDGISSADAGMAYSSINDAAKMVLHLGMGTDMAKIDIVSAFCLIPVQTNDPYLLGVSGVSQDNSLVLGLPGSGMCRAVIDNMLSTSQSLGVPLAKDKAEGPTISLVFLGIELDTVLMEARCPQTNSRGNGLELQEWAALKCCRRKELEHLLGVLNLACIVIPSGGALYVTCSHCCTRCKTPTDSSG